MHALSDSTSKSAISVIHISRWTKSDMEDELTHKGVGYRSESNKSELVTLLVITFALEQKKVSK